MRGFYLIWLSEKKKKMVDILYNWLIIIVYNTLNNIYTMIYFTIKREVVLQKSLMLGCYVMLVVLCE